ncbi:hypothetical protein C8F01DRAFT_1153564 [Mycena amicta]|nr:hypothetical protein C8F01DRAFT_1153564 [Mycena amicta]
MAQLRLNYYEKDLTDDIHRAETLHAAYRKEIPRLDLIYQLQSRRWSGSRPDGTTGCRHVRYNATLSLDPGSREEVRLQRLLTMFLWRSKEVEYYLKIKRSLAAPIRRLSPELLCLVFSFVVPSPHPIWVAMGETPNSAIDLAHVCTHWRALVLEDSRLWATLSTGPTSDSKGLNHISKAKFYITHSRQQPLAIRMSHWPIDSPLLKVLVGVSERWRFLALNLSSSRLTILDSVVGHVPLLTSLTLHQGDANRDASQLINAFAIAPSLRRLSFAVQRGHIWPARVYLPWAQLTSLTLSPISLTTFTECIANCSQLLYFDASVSTGLADPDISLLPPPRLPDSPKLGARRPLRTLLVRGSFCQDVLLLVLLANPPRPLFVFPHLRCLSLDMNGLQPDLYAALARCCRLEMLAIHAWSRAEMPDVLPFLLAAPTLRIVHFMDHKTAMVAPAVFSSKLELQNPVEDLDADEVEPCWKSLAELDVDKFVSYDVNALYKLLCASQNSIEAARLQRGAQSDFEEELTHLEEELTHMFYR